MIARLGKEINNPESVYYWAQKVRAWVGQRYRPWPWLAGVIFMATWGASRVSGEGGHDAKGRLFVWVLPSNHHGAGHMVPHSSEAELQQSE